MRDTSRQREVFPFIHHAMQDPRVGSVEKSRLAEATVDSIAELVALDPKVRHEPGGRVEGGATWASG